jgi:hypothetical protein
MPTVVEGNLLRALTEAAQVTLPIDSGRQFTSVLHAITACTNPGYELLDHAWFRAAIRFEVGIADYLDPRFRTEWERLPLVKKVECFIKAKEQRIGASSIGHFIREYLGEQPAT